LAVDAPCVLTDFGLHWALTPCALVLEEWNKCICREIVPLANLIGRAFTHDEERVSGGAFDYAATARPTGVRILCRFGQEQNGGGVRRCAHTRFDMPSTALLAVDPSKSYSGRSAFVPMMQPTHFGDGDEAASVGELHTAWIRRILVQCEMHASALIVSNERLKVPRRTALVKIRQRDRGIRDVLCQ
jgi:hypothetical protein